MDQQLNLIFELKDLKKTYKKNTVLSIGRLQFHRGTTVSYTHLTLPTKA